MPFTPGQVLTAQQLNEAFSLTSARATRATTGPSVSGGSWGQVTWPDVEYDTDEIINVANGVITLPTAGRYRIVVSFPWRSFSSEHDRAIAIFAGTAATGKPAAAIRSTTPGSWYAQVELEKEFAAGARLSVWIWCDVSDSTGGAPTESLAPLNAITVARV